jgi:hypothetical protein
MLKWVFCCRFCRPSPRKKVFTFYRHLCYKHSQARFLPLVIRDKKTLIARRLRDLLSGPEMAALQPDADAVSSAGTAGA